MKEDDVPGAFGPGYIFNPAVFGSSSEDQRDIDRMIAEGGTWADVWREGHEIQDENGHADQCPHCGEILHERRNLLVCRFCGPIKHKES
jgi:hypothetical protein